MSYTPEKLIDLSKFFSNSFISIVSCNNLLEISYSVGISDSNIAFSPIFVEAKEES